MTPAATNESSRPHGLDHAIACPIKTGVNAENANHGRWHARIVPLVVVAARKGSRRRGAQALGELPCLGVGH